MADLGVIMAEISATKAKLTSAEIAGDRDLIIVYGNILNQQQQEKNFLLAAEGNLV